MQSIKRIRRNQSQWQQIISDWQASQLSAREFCLDNNLAYASFCNWRRKLSGKNEVVAEPDGLFKLLPVKDSPAGHWNITLKLGNDVELVLSR